MPKVLATLDDERQPLLGDSTSRQASNNEENAEDTDALPKKRSRKAMFLYGVLILLGCILFAFFIKGFLDADDVDVSDDAPRHRTEASHK